MSNKKNKTIIITGGNTGLGYECAKNIASNCDTNHIVIACRNSEKSNEAVKSLISDTKNINIHSLELDLASLESIREFSHKFINLNLPPLYAIVCNAGVHSGSETKYTKDGFEMTFGVNHLGHFLLVNLLLSEMSDGGKILFVSSDTHDPLQKTGMPAPVYSKAEWLAYPDKSNISMSHRERYSTSKLCNVYCTYELANRIKSHTGKNITVNAFNPGMMPGTGLGRNYNLFMRFLWNYVAPILIVLKKNVNTVTKSGKNLAMLITDPKFNNITGKYFDGIKQIPSSKLSYNKNNSEDLWTTSVKLVNLTKEESILL